jgi:hypothetical protein
MDIDLNAEPDQQMQEKEHDEVSHTNAIVQVMNEGMISMHIYKEVRQGYQDYACTVLF